jgi:hypothetical protein
MNRGDGAQVDYVQRNADKKISLLTLLLFYHCYSWGIMMGIREIEIYPLRFLYVLIRMPAPFHLAARFGPCLLPSISLRPLDKTYDRHIHNDYQACV